MCLPRLFVSCAHYYQVEPFKKGVSYSQDCYKTNSDPCLDSVSWWMTHSDVPGAFAVGFVVTGESLAGHDARVCHQVASAVEHRPKRASHNRHLKEKFTQN